MTGSLSLKSELSLFVRLYLSFLLTTFFIDASVTRFFARSFKEHLALFTPSYYSYPRHLSERADRRSVCSFDQTSYICILLSWHCPQESWYHNSSDVLDSLRPSLNDNILILWFNNSPASCADISDQLVFSKEPCRHVPSLLWLL